MSALWILNVIGFLCILGAVVYIAWTHFQDDDDDPEHPKW